MNTDHPTSTPTELPEPPSLRVVEAVAEADGVDPAMLDPPLYEVLDPEALDRLFAPTPTDPSRGTVRFDYRGHEVTVRADGTVDVT
ncbi:hypothetical protein Halru_2957 [Halovivax ruber XH-70]|uniref:Halobacterial output domain-containing protein n=1 Tax=Halovivax ruber (strain DSM 18193 / JCM 13892 / XH-70) TaxID=797302 RepID=L0IHR4_HALRX|nr:HalOD1 output domain-containing protein [Halovivax ruber]AGB17527.1 hypothetical protein Halru_2957 [Halovivax ruber XH-70]